MNQVNLEKTPTVLQQKEKIALLELTPRQVRLIFAWQIHEVCFEVFDEFIEPIKIYEDINRDGFIKPTQIAECVEIVKMYRKLCDALGVQKAVAYATTSFREAKNHYGFLEELEIASGFKIRLLQDQDEMVAIYSGVVNTLDAPKGIIIYIDDEYTQLIQYSRKTLINFATIPFGSESLATLFLDSVSNPEKQMQEMCDFFKQQIKENVSWIETPLDEEFKIVGVGETFASIGKISRRGKRYPLDIAHAYEVQNNDFDNVYNAIKGLDLDKRARIKGISTKSANTVASGLSIVKAILETLETKNFVISSSDLSTGIFFSQCMPSTVDKPIVDIVMYGLQTNLHFHELGNINHLHIYELSAILFRQLRVMHKLGRQYLRALKVASFLCDSGSRLRYNPTRKDSLQVILSTQLYGLSHKDQIIAAFVASSQISEEFSLSEWVKYKDIVDDEDLQAVKKLAVILRIAVALDRSQQGHITDLVCDVLGDSVIMKTVSNSPDIQFELKCASEASGDFKKIFGKNLELL